MKKKYVASYLLMAITCPSFVMASDQIENENLAVVDDISYVVRSDGWSADVINYYSQGVPQNKYKMMFITEKEERAIPKHALQVALIDSSGNQVIGKEVKGSSKCSGVGYGPFFQCSTRTTFDKPVNNYQEFVVNELDNKGKIVGSSMMVGKLPEFSFSLEASQSGGDKDVLVITNRGKQNEIKVDDITVKEKQGEKNYITIGSNGNKKFDKGVYRVSLNLAKCPQDTGVFSWVNAIDVLFIINGEEVPYSIALKGSCDPMRLKIKQAEVDKAQNSATLKNITKNFDEVKEQRNIAAKAKKAAEDELQATKSAYDQASKDLQKAVDALSAIAKAKESEKLLNDAKKDINESVKKKLLETVATLTAELNKAKDVNSQLQNDITIYQEARRIYLESVDKQEEANTLAKGIPAAETRLNVAEEELQKNQQQLDKKRRDLETIMNNIKSLSETISVDGVEAQKQLAQVAVDACKSYLRAAKAALELQQDQRNADEFEESLTQ